MTKAGERLIKAAKEAAELARTPPAKREWVEWRVIGTKPWVGNGPSFETLDHAKEYVKAWMGKGEAIIIKTRVTVIE